MFKIKKNLFCHNCGKTNHKFSNCNEPISSYGLICYNENRIILVRRKFTFAFMDFIMGKYDVNDIIYISLLFSRMTKTELANITSLLDFDNLRNIIGLTKITRAHKQEYENSKIKFTYIKNMGIIDQCILIINKIFNENFNTIQKSFNHNNHSNNHSNEIDNHNTHNSYNNNNYDSYDHNQQQVFTVNKDTINKIKKLISNTFIYEEPEWEIPKGKRNDRENNISTAIREFIEETSFENVTVFKNIIPLEEEYTAINNNKYKHIYYLAKLKNYENNDNSNNSFYEDHIIDVDVNASDEQKKEVSAVGIININNIEKYLRSYQIEKKKVIYKSYQIFNNYKQFFY